MLILLALSILLNFLKFELVPFNFTLVLYYLLQLDKMLNPRVIEYLEKLKEIKEEKIITELKKTTSKNKENKTKKIVIKQCIKKE